MATPAVSIVSRIVQIKETTFNQTPASPTMTDVPFVDCSLTVDINNVLDNSIQGDALHRTMQQTTQKDAGTLSGEVSHSNMDWETSPLRVPASF